jgi:hypothetical protein
VVDASSGFGFERELASAICPLDGYVAPPGETSPSVASAKTGADNSSRGVAEPLDAPTFGAAIAGAGHVGGIASAGAAIWMDSS